MDIITANLYAKQKLNAVSLLCVCIYIYKMGAGKLLNMSLRISFSFSDQLLKAKKMVRVI